jgi:transposase
MKPNNLSKRSKTTSEAKVVQDSSTLADAPSLYTRIVELREDQGLSYAKIAASLAVSKSTVSKYLKMWRDRTPVSEVKPTGRPRKADDAVKRQIRSIISKNPHIASKGMAAKLNQSSNTVESAPISDRTVRRTLKEMSYSNSLPMVVPYITDVQKNKRVDWCRKNAKINWNHVVFSDETSVELDRCKVRRWHPRGKRPTVGKTKHSRKIMFWSAISARGRAPLYAISGTVNSDRYIELLETALLPWFRENCGAAYLFQQDNAPAHVSKKTLRFLHSSDIQVLEWPPNSPDLNPIENLRAVLKEAIEKRCPSNLHDLDRIAKEEWAKIPQQKIRDAIKSMPRRMGQVLEKEGEKCDY